MRQSARRGRGTNNGGHAPQGMRNDHGARGTPTRGQPPRNPRIDDKLADEAIGYSSDDDEREEDIAQVLVAVVGTLLVGVLYLALPDIVSFGPRWLPLVLEAILLAPIVITHLLAPRIRLPFAVARALAIALLVVVTGALVGSVVLLVLHIADLNSGAQLLHPSALLWVINIFVWAVWYWEIDGNGPRERNRRPRVLATDFIFPQLEHANPSNWRPGFVDYLFLSFSTTTTLGPADTFPLTHRAKVLMMVEAGLSLLIVAVLISRAVGILT